MAVDTSLNISDLGLKSMTLDKVLGVMKKIYGLTG
jgi:hypothetical protein